MTTIARSRSPKSERPAGRITTETVHYQVVHWITGRFRIRIPRLGFDAEYGARLLYVVGSLPAVTTVRINPPACSLVVEYSPKLFGEALATVQGQIFESIQVAANPKIPALSNEKVAPAAATHQINYWERLGLPALGLGLSVASLMGVPVPSYVIASVVIAGAMPVFQRAWEAIQEEKQLTIDFLDGLAIALHTMQGNYFAPSFMLGLIEGGEVIRDLTARRSERANLDLLDCLGKTAFVERGRHLRWRWKFKDIVEGDRVVVYPGDQIPVDGIILRGTGLIDQCKLTGESVPVTRTEGMEVFASTLLVDGQLVVLAERVGNNTRAGVIVGLMQSAPVHDTRIENYAAVVANQMVVPTLAIGTGVGLLSGDLNRAIALLTLIWVREFGSLCPPQFYRH